MYKKINTPFALATRLFLLHFSCLNLFQVFICSHFFDCIINWLGLINFFCMFMWTLICWIMSEWNYLSLGNVGLYAALPPSNIHISILTHAEEYNMLGNLIYVSSLKTSLRNSAVVSEFDTNLIWNIKFRHHCIVP